MNHNTLGASPEFEEKAIDAVHDGLIAAYHVHEDLGADGVNAVEINQFGDQAMAADVQSERVVLDTLQAAGISATVHSEEHGVVEINHDLGEPVLAVLDGLDGSSLYKKERGEALYGTMFAIFENGNPTYNQYIAAGLTLPSIHKMLLATRGEGVKVVDLETGETGDVHTSTDNLTRDALIFADGVETPVDAPLHDYFQNNYDTFVKPLLRDGFETHRTGSSAAYYAQVAMGEALVVGESTRKGNLEYATAYALIKEAGGLFVSAETWEDIGEQPFLTYGQDRHIAHVAVANSTVLTQLKDTLAA
jgi:fructose-1,6-bisphosphatase/inositol monophosphatase family enzyme